ncbi:DUF2142 domain-containing protein [Specibacter sp. NPDC057265]|uniref:DUF2142 domain-containing protein n=1 Tax=Specibacter sp. NPDC057265 TaxID=3346075 RepID=UPI0036392181
MDTVKNKISKRSSMSDTSRSGSPKISIDKTVNSPKRLFMSLFLAFAVLGGIWSVATPLMAYPDEPSHTIRAAAVVRGQVTPQEGQSFGNGVHVLVPSYIANLEGQRCFVFFADRTADCAPVIPGQDTFDAIGVTSAGAYNPMYYAVVGLPSLVMSGAPALYAMRIVSVLFSAVFFAAAFMSLNRLRKAKWPLVTATIAVTPMVLFLSSGINPNSLEISATLAAFCAFLAVLDRSGDLRSVVAPIATVVLSTAVLANTRSVSLVWLLCAVVGACLFFRWESTKRVLSNRLVLIGMGIAAAGVVLGLLWMVLASRAPASSGSAPEGIVNPAPGVAPYQAFVTMLDRTFDFIPQYIGIVGWLDTAVPQGVMAFWSMLFIALLLLSLLARPRKLAISMAVALVAVAVVPALLQAMLITTVGFFWQGRYTMPLVLTLFVAAGLALRTRGFPTGRRRRSVARALFWAALAAHVIGFLYVLRRYVVGIIDISTWQTMISHPSWQPPLGWFVLTLIYAVVMLFVAQRFYAFLFPGHKLFVAPAIRLKRKELV